MKPKLDNFDHVAIQVSDIKKSLAWYTQHFNCQVTYEDDSWAMLEFNNIKLALVVASQHPPHFAITSDNANKFGKLTKHRDNSESIYIKDPDGNAVEIIKPY